MNIRKEPLQKLPGEIAKQWHIVKCLSIKEKSQTYLLKDTQQETYCIEKTFSRTIFSKRKFKKLSHFSDSFLLLPSSLYYESGVYFLMYPYFTTLKEILYQKGISLYELLSLGIDLTEAVLELIKQDFLEADISPNNIYQKEDGNFCLGDISVQNFYQTGTPGFIAPELTKKPESTVSFDHSMQYSICRLLNSVYQLNPTVQKENITRLFHRGMEQESSLRFASLEDLKKNLLEQREQLEAEEQYQRIQIKEPNHFLFRVKTLPLQTGKKLNIFPILWCFLMITGCFFLVTLYRQLHPSPIFPQQKPFMSQISYNTSPAATFITESPENNTAHDIKVRSTELDVQNNGLTSFSLILNKTKTPDTVSCVYAGENRLTDTVSVHRFSHLKELYLNNNCIYQLTEITSVSELEILVLSYNQLTELPDLSGLSRLNYLDISGNPHFKTVDCLVNLSTLDTLNISGTAISKKDYQLLCRKLPNCQIIY